MRHFAFVILLFGFVLALGCGKKPAPPDPAPEQPKPGQPPPPPVANTPTERDKLIAGLKSGKQETRLYSIEELSWLAEDDPAVLTALVELLKDKSTAGSGRTLPNRINSTREAAALTLLRCTHGEKVLKEKGLPVLREGLADPSAAVREHTIYTIGQLGVVAKPLAPDVQKLCTDPDANVRGVAFDTLRLIGVADPVALAKLLKHKDEEVVRLAAELIPLVETMPEGAVAPLTEALASENSNIRSAAATGLALAGPKAAPAVQQLTDLIKKSYPEQFDAKTAQLNGPEAAYWKPLGKIGEPAVAPTAKLLEHPNMLVRMLAARTLGEIGEPARSAKDALKKALGDMTIDVAMEAAITLCQLEESIQDSIDLMKRGINAPNDAVAGYAIQGIPRLGAHGKELIPLALSKMGDTNPNTRAGVLLLVAQLPPTEGAKVAADVGKRATDEFPEIRRLAGQILMQLGPAGAPAADALGKALPAEKELDIRDQFVESLLAMGATAKPALPGLLPLLADQSLAAELRAKIAGLVVVADPASPEVAAALVKASTDGTLGVRIAVAAAMGQLNPLPADALATLIKIAKTDPRADVRTAAVRALAAAGPRAKAARGELESLATSQMLGLALWAKVALAAVDGNVKSAAPLIRTGLGERSAQARAAAAESLLLIGPTMADLPALMKLLKDANGPTKSAAARNIAQLGINAKDAVPHLVRLLDDNDYEVRLAAAEALGRIGPASKPAVAKLKELSNDPLVRATAQRALDRIEKK